MKPSRVPYAVLVLALALGGIGEGCATLAHARPAVGGGEACFERPSAPFCTEGRWHFDLCPNALTPAAYRGGSK